MSGLLPERGDVIEEAAAEQTTVEQWLAIRKEAALKIDPPVWVTMGNSFRRTACARRRWPRRGMAALPAPRVQSSLREPRGRRSSAGSNVEQDK
jgi:hypothetical protein